MRATRSKTKLASTVEEVPQVDCKTTKRPRKSPLEPASTSASSKGQPAKGKRIPSTSKPQEPKEIATSAAANPNNGVEIPLNEEIIVLSDSEMPNLSAFPSESSGRKPAPRKRAKPKKTTEKVPAPIVIDIVSSDSNSNSNSSNVESLEPLLIIPAVPENVVSSSDRSDAGSNGSCEDLLALNKKLNHSRRISTSSESDSDSSIEGSEEKILTNTNNFANLFTKTQGKLHASNILSNDAVHARNVNDPVAKKLLQKTRGRVLSASSKKPANCKTFDAEKKSTSASKKPSKAETAIEKPVTAGQLAIADMDTDTEVDMEDESAGKVEKGRLNGFGDDDVDRLNDSLDRFMETLKPVKKQSSSYQKSSETVPKTKAKTRGPVAIISPLKVAKFDGLRYQPGYVSLIVKFRAERIKFDANEDWDVETVRKTLAEKVNIPPIDILLFTSDNISMSDGKKLKDFGISVLAELDALVRVNEPSSSTEKPEDSISIKFQKSGVRKPVYLDVSKFAEFSEIRTKLAQKLSIDDASSLHFKFDGENISLSECPADLDMDNEDCVDVFEK